TGKRTREQRSRWPLFSDLRSTEVRGALFAERRDPLVMSGRRDRLLEQIVLARHDGAVVGVGGVLGEETLDPAEVAVGVRGDRLGGCERLAEERVGRDDPVHEAD